MIIAATGDAHSPQYFEGFVRAVDGLKVKPDLFLMVGDMVNRGDLKEYDKIYNTLFGKVNCPIFSCFGNNEFQEIREEIRKRYSDIKFLDDQSIILTVGEQAVGIVGTTGSLDTPTPWQKANVPNIEKIYQQRVSFVDSHLQRMVLDLPLTIVLMHYAPSFKTLEGENPRFYTSQGSQMYENVFVQRKPSLVIHGHSHRGTKQAWVDTVPIFNVSLPLNKQIVVIDTEKDLKPGIAKFV
jgi:Icc-related predicted phosphoesterase